MDDMIPLEKLPMADIAAYLEINPPQLPYNSLVGAPSAGKFACALLDEFIVPAGGGISGFGLSLLGKLAPASYAHLMIILSARSTAGTDQPFFMQFNTDTSPFSTNYDWHSSSGGNASGDSHIPVGTILNTASPFPAPIEIIIPDYTNPADGKGVICTSGSLGHAEVMSAGWHLAQAITQVEFQAAGGSNIKAGSRFTFYAFGSP